MIRFAREALSVIRPAVELMREHWEEIVVDDRTMDVDWDTVLDLERRGGVMTLTARDATTDELVGYAVFFLLRHLHAKATITAQNDVIFLRKTHRGGRNGMRFLKYCEAELTGVAHLVLWHVKPATNFGPALEALGCRVHETIYAKRLRKGD
jgi:hypothetical protein